MTANNALQGRTGSSSSGRAIIASQQGGLVEISPLTDRHRHFKVRVYRAIWDRVRQFWNEEKWIRVTDNDDNVRFVGLNREMTVGEQIVEDAVKQGASKEEAIQYVQQQAMQNPQMAAQLNQRVRVNVPAEMDMDIIVNSSPDSITIQQEQFEQIANMAQSGVPFPPEVIIRASSLRNKEELIEALKPQQQQPDPMQEQMMQLEFAGRQADLENTQAKTAETKTKAIKNLSDAENADAAQILKEQEMAQNTPISQFTGQFG